MLRDDAQFEALAAMMRRAALGEVSWESVMAAISAACDATSANLAGVDQGMLQFIHTNDLDPAMFEELGTTIQSETDNPRLMLTSRGGVMQVVEGVDFGSDVMTRRFPVFGEVCRKYDVGFGVQMCLEREAGRVVGLALLRGRRAEHGSPDDARTFKALAPQVLEAVKLARMIEDQGVALARNSLEAVRSAAFLCDGWGRVRGLTPAAEALVEADGPLLLKDGRLTARGDSATQALAEAVYRATRNPLEPLKTLVVQGLDGLRWAVDVAPLPTVEHSLGFAPSVIVIVRQRKAHADAALIASLLGLTAAEASVAAALAGGASREDIALARGVSVQTIKHQVKQIFAKTGVTRESELIVLLHRRL
ncbi:MAG: helix-turn-helix transcriptional regulator [Brevundimonas sp.]|uniref:helix-turn-helix transcriptional regulator n=1 Tax=Brevundimonas sp. TaxID=1871086 RepID=UPI00391BC624